MKRKENLFPEIVEKREKMKRFRFLHQFLTNNQNNICCRKTQKMKQARAELDAILGGSEMPVVSSEYEDYQVVKLESLKLILMK